MVDALLQVNRGLQQWTSVASNNGLKLLLLLTVALLTLNLRFAGSSITQSPFRLLHACHLLRITMYNVCMHQW